MYNIARAEFLIKQELSFFPKATLTDIYKLFYQNCQGSGHFCNDITIIKKRIRQEIEDFDLTKYIYPDYDISYLFPIKRISLFSIKSGKFDLNFIADKFLKLTEMSQSLSLEEWIKEWMEISQLTFKLKPEIVNDISDINLFFKNSPHHSDVYSRNYKPHYRICNL